MLLAFHIPVKALDVSAASAIVINADTLEIIYEKNARTRRSMASTTKIMTALLLCESETLDEVITCSKNAVAVEGSALGLKAGDKITGRDILQGLLLASGNDAANVIAEQISGSNEKFAQKMNDKAREIGLKDTNFVTPSGLDSDEHYTTAYDMALLTAYALKNSDFADAVSKSTANIYINNTRYTIKNHNRLLKTYDGCIGVKTGFTKKSGRCLVSAAKREDRTVVAVTLNAPSDWDDHSRLLDYGFSRLALKTYTADGTKITVPIINSHDICELSFNDIKVSHIPENRDKISINIVKPDYLFAPIEKAEIGRVEVLFEERVIASYPLRVKGTIIKNEYIEPTFKEKFITAFKIMLKTF